MILPISQLLKIGDERLEGGGGIAARAARLFDLSRARNEESARATCNF